MMKLLSYHIENYGKIHDQDGNFADGITCFCEKNGYGKTTLASFIKAMFYGLPSYTTKTKSFDDRQHFYPFAGGKFGGNLTFEMQGKTYKIERFFDKKSSKGDEVRVYCNGSPFFGFGEEIGKEIFGLDEESFKKTVFITAEEMEISSTHSINEKLNRGVDSSDEENDYEAAIDALEKARKNLKAARGNNDRISEKKSEIIELTAQIGNLKEMGDGLQEEYVERERLTKEISALETAQKSENERNLLLQKWETVDRMEAQAATKYSELSALREKYPLGVPSAEERKELNECLQAQSALQGALNTVAFSAEKEESLHALQEKFREGVPTENELNETQGNVYRLTALSTEEARLSAYEKTQKEKLLESKFSVRMPEAGELAEMRATVEEYKRKDAKLKELSATLLSASPTEGKRTGKIYFVLFALAAVLCLAGSLLLFVDKIAGGIVIAVAAAMIVGAIVKAKSGVNATMPPSNAGIDMANVQAEVRLTEEKIRAFTMPYGYYGNAGAVYDFFALEEDLKAYKEYLSSEESRNARIEALSEEKKGLYGRVRAFLARYGEDTGSLQNGLNALRAALASYCSLQADQEEAQRSGQSFRARREESEKRTAAILGKYGFSSLVATMDGLKSLEIDCKALSDLEKEVLSLRGSALEYKEKNALEVRPEGEATNADELHARLSLLRKQLAECDKRIAETERSVEKLSDYESALERAQEQLSEYKEKHGLLSDTISALQDAEQKLKDRYIAPIKDRFSHYAEAIERVLDEKVRMDKDFRIVFERGGEDRSERHLSAGERSICALCLRLALIDNMYENESPFIVMDDPFVHLDREHLEKTLNLLGELGKERQIVYFCCHESRQPAWPT